MKRKSILLVPLAILAPSAAMALGIRVPDQDPFATARGNAFVATADNPSAIYYNPAGITQLDGQNVRSGFYGIYLDDRYTANGTTINTHDQFSAVPQLYFTTTLGDLPLSLGLGIYSPYGLTLDWPNDAPSYGKGQVTDIEINPVIAWKVAPTFSIAAGASANYSQAYINYSLPAPPGSPVARLPLRLRGDDLQPGFNLGALWQPCQYVSLGATYRSETIMKYGGHATTIAGTTSASADFPLPQNATAGISVRPSTNWNFEFDVDWTDWNQLNNVPIQGTHTPPLGAPVNLAFDWSSSLMYEFGATRYFENGWRASGGYMFSQNSVPDGQLYALVPDSDRHIFSVGVGQTHGRMSWDIAYQFAWGPTRTINSPPGAGDYEFFSHALTASLGYHF